MSEGLVTFHKLSLGFALATDATPSFAPTQLNAVAALWNECSLQNVMINLYKLNVFELFHCMRITLNFSLQMCFNCFLIFLIIKKDSKVVQRINLSVYHNIDMPSNETANNALQNI